MEKRYQVFVSSTFKDLVKERQEIIEALLELDCIPSGMELFPAADDDQWTLIKRVIDDCDYYVVVIAGRYGSIGSTGTSYTQMEYEYASSIGKPIIAFLHGEPGSLPVNRTESVPEAQQALLEFRALAERRLCKYWTTPKELGSVVSRSLVKLMKTRPGIGWVRGNTVANESSVLRLKTRILNLEKKLSNLRPTGLLSVSTSPYTEVDWGSLFRGAKRLDLFFGYGQTWRNSHTEELARLARTQDASIRLALPDPEVPRILSEMANRSGCDEAQMRSRIYGAAKQILSLEARANISVFFTPVMPLFSLFRFDHVAVMPFYTHRRGRRSVVVTLVFGEGMLMDYAATEFESLIEEESGARKADLASVAEVGP